MIKIATGRLTVNNVATQIVGERPGRKELRIIGSFVSPGTLGVGPDSSVTTANSWGNAGQSLLVLPGVEGEVWAIQSSSSPSNVQFIEIYDDGM